MGRCIARSFRAFVTWSSFRDRHLGSIPLQFVRLVSGEKGWNGNESLWLE